MQMLYNDCMDARKKLANEIIKIKGERDHAEKQLISKTSEFSAMQINLDQQRIDLKKKEQKMETEKKDLKEEQKKLKKLLSKVLTLSQLFIFLYFIFL